MTNMCSLSLSLVDASLGGEVVGTGSGNGGLINRDDGTVGVGNQVGVQVEGATIAVGNWGSVGIDSTNSDGSSNGSSSSVGSSLGSEVVGTSSGHGGFISGDDGTVGVGDQVGVQVQGAGVAIADSRDSSDGGGNGGSSDGGSSNGNGSDGGVLDSPGGKVVSTGGSNSGLINGDNSSVGVTNQVSVQVEGARVAVASSVDGSSSNSRDSCNSRGSCITNTSISKSSTATTGSKVVGTSSSNCWLVHRDNGTVGVTNQTVLRGREGDTGGENQELHCCFQLCARAQTPHVLC